MGKKYTIIKMLQPYATSAPHDLKLAVILEAFYFGVITRGDPHSSTKKKA